MSAERSLARRDGSRYGIHGRGLPLICGISVLLIVAGYLGWDPRTSQPLVDERSGYVYARDLLDEGRFEEGEAELREHLRRFPHAAAARRDLAWLLFETFRPRQVEQFLVSCLERAPADHWTLSSLLTSEFRPRSPREGLPLLQSAEKRQPGQPAVERALAYCLWQSGETDLARQHFLRALSRSPYDLETRLSAAGFFLEQGKLEAAELLLSSRGEEDEATSLRNCFPNDDRWWWLQCQLAQSRGEYADALALLEHSLSLRACNLEYLQHRAMLLAQLGRTADAEEAYATAGHLERCREQLLRLVAGGAAEQPTPEDCRQIARLCAERGAARQAKGWQRLALELER